MHLSQEHATAIGVTSLPGTKAFLGFFQENSGLLFATAVEQPHEALVLSGQFDFSIEIVNPGKYEFVAVRRPQDHIFLPGFLELCFS